MISMNGKKTAWAAALLAAFAILAGCAGNGKDAAGNGGSPSATEQREATPASVTASGETPAASVAPGPEASASAVPSDEPTESAASAAAPSAEPEDERDTRVPGGTVEYTAKGGAKAAKLPLFGMKQVTYGADDGANAYKTVPDQPLPAVGFDIPPAQQKALAAYWLDIDARGYALLMLGPAAWTKASGAVGANGSFGIRLENAEDALEYLATYDTAGGCQGCAISSIGLYFPELAKWADEQGFSVEPSGEAPYIRAKAYGKHMITFEAKSDKAGYVRLGAAYQEHDGGGAWFRSMTIQVKKASKPLAETIVAYYTKMYGGDEGGEAESSAGK
ncbi:DUF4850 domain-containing protein [Cohnella nanjingensis]|uniref:DUF4850 domain-containing protein n=1 Tax=Cohnella nanjingensis TaxID=1387779 RepID=A0A7X0VFR2_9BACL|nr:DUF4850 domain-containing protein [Cohnella nanjingensis]MBB6672310.1 DUF4850 domain-containing protein [Cohnella nanjingensis]